MAVRVRLWGRRKATLLQGLHKRPPSKRWSSNFTNKPKRSYKSWTSCKATTTTTGRRKTSVNSTWTISSLNRYRRNSYKTATTTKYQAVPSRATASQVPPSTLIRRSSTRRWPQPGFRTRLPPRTRRRRSEGGEWFWKYYYEQSLEGIENFVDVGVLGFFDLPKVVDCVSDAPVHPHQVFELQHLLLNHRVFLWLLQDPGIGRVHTLDLGQQGRYLMLVARLFDL